jgi:integrase/recombinase XerD
VTDVVPYWTPDNEPRATVAAIPEQATTDERVLALWLHGRPANTARAYRWEAGAFLVDVAKPLRAVTLADLQGYADRRGHLAPATQARSLDVIRSLFRFAHTIGYLGTFNPAAALRVPIVENVLAPRILEEIDVQKMIGLETDTRNRVLLRLLYAAGIRVSELAGLTWGDTAARGETGQVTVIGKGEKARSVLLSTATWSELIALRAGTDDAAPIFASKRTAGHLGQPQLWRIVRAAARRAGLDAPVSPHWLRHAHASHALDRGAPIHLVKETLGHRSIATTGKYLHARPSDSSAMYLPV